MRPAAVLAVAFALASTCAGAADDPTAPPTDVQPTTMTLKRLLALHRSAAGSLVPGTPHTRTEVWTYQDGPLTGTQSSVASGSDYREDTSLGPFHSSQGELHGARWEHNRNGLTRTVSGVHERDGVNEQALAHPFLPGSGVALLGEVTSPLHAYVVKVAPHEGRVEYVFYDTSTYFIARDESAVEGRRIVYTYDDFRTTAGLTQAWHIHRSNGFKDDDADWKMQSLAIGKPVALDELAIPGGTDPVALSSARVALPAKLSGDRVILTVQLGGHKVNLQLDSGASGILLNRQVADATGVQSFGQKTEVTAGQYSASDAVVPKIDFGVATMQNVAVQTAPYTGSTYDGAPVAGLMGYDFIAGAVIHIDYYDGTVEAIAPASFRKPAGAVPLPVRLDDGVPIVEAKIGSAVARNFVVDTGADRSMIFSNFAQAHPGDVPDLASSVASGAALPFLSDISGVGGKVDVRPVNVPSLSLGTITLPDWLFDVSQDAPSFEGDDYDGLIGQDVLRNFDVYFDYPAYMLYLVPNERYRQRWGT